MKLYFYTLFEFLRQNWRYFWIFYHKIFEFSCLKSKIWTKNWKKIILNNFRKKIRNSFIFRISKIQNISSNWAQKIKFTRKTIFGQKIAIWNSVYVPLLTESHFSTLLKFNFRGMIMWEKWCATRISLFSKFKYIHKMEKSSHC